MSSSKSNKKYKDTKFHLFGSLFTVKFIDSIKKIEGTLKQDTNYEGFKYGLFIPDKQVIYIATKDSEGNNLDDSIIKITLLHEIFHAIFTTGCYNNSSSDEPLVEWTARCLFSLLDQNFITANFNLCKENVG